MDLNCLKCHKILTESSSIYATKCGHIFHGDCILTFLACCQQCPHCSEDHTPEEAIKIFVNTPDVSQESSLKLKEQLCSLNNELELKKNEFRQTKICHEKTIQEAEMSREKLSGMQQEETNNKRKFYFKGMTLNYHRQLMKNKEKFYTEANHLRKRLRVLRSMNEILYGPENRIEDFLLRSILNRKELSLIVDKLVESLEETDKENNSLDNDLLCYQNELIAIENDLESLKKEYFTLLKNMEEDKEDCSIFAEIKKNVSCLIKNRAFEDLEHILAEFVPPDEITRMDLYYLIISLFAYIVGDLPDELLTEITSTPSTEASEIVEPSIENLLPPSPLLRVKKKGLNMVKTAGKNPLLYLQSGKVELFDSEDELENTTQKKKKIKIDNSSLNNKFTNRKFKNSLKKIHSSTEVMDVDKKPKSQSKNKRMSFSSLFDLIETNLYKLD